MWCFSFFSSSCLVFPLVIHLKDPITFLPSKALSLLSLLSMPLCMNRIKTKNSSISSLMCPLSLITHCSYSSKSITISYYPMWVGYTIHIYITWHGNNCAGSKKCGKYTNVFQQAGVIMSPHPIMEAQHASHTHNGYCLSVSMHVVCFHLDAIL